MRHCLFALVGILLMGLSICSAAAAETGSRWWPFGRSDAAPENSAPVAAPARSEMPDPTAEAEPTPPGQYPADEDSERHWMINSPLGKVSWPRLHMPEVPKPRVPQLPQKSEVETARNAWVEENPESAAPSPLQALKNGARRVGDSTRGAWDKTVDAITPGDRTSESSSRVARQATRPPWWKRMFAPEEPPEGPQTITEWMAQDRLDP